MLGAPPYPSQSDESQPPAWLEVAITVLEGILSFGGDVAVAAQDRDDQLVMSLSGTVGKGTSLKAYTAKTRRIIRREEALQDSPVLMARGTWGELGRGQPAGRTHGAGQHLGIYDLQSKPFSQVQQHLPLAFLL
jgi:hypothetical protein